MRNSERSGFRPGLEAVEDRCLAAAHGPGAVVSGFALHGAAQAQVAGLAGQVHRPLAHARPVAPTVAAAGKVVVFGSPGGASQGGLPSNYRDWGVITFWNTTSRKVTLSVSASTYQGGQFFNFTLRPGAYQSYYASFNQFNGQAPQFRVSFDPIQHTNAILLTEQNIVFERARWFPRVGTEGRPYAVATNVSGLYLAPI